MTNTPCARATDRQGRKIARGTTVLYLGCPSGEHFGIQPVPVKVIDIHRQGADGTVLTCDSAPKPDYPHHMSCRASDTVVVPMKNREAKDESIKTDLKAKVTGAEGPDAERRFHRMIDLLIQIGKEMEEKR